MAATTISSVQAARDREHFEHCMAALDSEILDSLIAAVEPGARCIPFLDQEFVFGCVVHAIVQERARRDALPTGADR